MVFEQKLLYCLLMVSTQDQEAGSRVGVLLKISGDVSSSVMALSDQDFKIPPQTFLQMLSENKVLHVTQDVMSTSGPK